MKKILSSFFLLAASVWVGVASAQTYESLWKEARAAMQKDQPRTALAVVQRVYAKAYAEKDDGQQLRALLTRYQLMGELSPDSAKAEIARLESFAVAEQRPEVRALWQSALARLWLQNRADTAAVGRGRACLRASLADFAVLGSGKATDYLPLFIRGEASGYYGDDLLSVLLAAALDTHCLEKEEQSGLLERAIRHYRSCANRPATLLASLDSLSRFQMPVRSLSEAPAWERLQRIAADYEDLPVNVETYIAMTQIPLYGSDDSLADSTLLAAARRGLSLYGKQPRANVLRNFIGRTTRKSLGCADFPNTLYPGRACTVGLRSRNVSQVQLRFYRLQADASDPVLRKGRADDIWKLKKSLVRTETLAISGVREFGLRTDSLSFTAPEAGVYVCELLADGKRFDRQVLYVSRLHVMNLAISSGHNRVVVVDGESGTPVAGARIEEYARNGGGRRAVHAADSAGGIHLHADRGWRWDFYPQTDTDRFHPAFSPDMLYGADTARVEAISSMRLFTDRAIYRPGQTVRFGGVVYTRRGDEVATASAYRTAVRLIDSNGKEVAVAECRTDSFGQFSGEFNLPSACLPGRFSLRGGQGAVSGYVSFRVEEYKRPTFTAETDEVTVPYAFGDTVTVSGKATAYTGLPVAGARVSYRVNRSTFHMVADGYSAAGEAVTDSLGRFRIPVCVAAEGLDAAGDWPRTYVRCVYEVQIDVTADNGETASASSHLYAASRHSVVEAAWPATLCREQLPRVTVNNTNASGQNVPGRGVYTLLRRVDGHHARTAAPNAGNPALGAEKSGLGAENFTLGADSVYIGGSGSRSAGLYVRMGQGTFETGTPFVPKELAVLPSGEYLAVSAVDGVAAADTAALLLFSEADVRPAGSSVCWSHVRRSERGDSVWVMVGSPERDVTLFYDLIYKFKSQVTTVESRRIVLSDSLLRFQLAYRPEYGDGAKIVMAFVKGGRTYEVTAEVERPVPEKKLCLRWSTFRSPLTPGMREEWRLTVTRPDGTPADAVLMACLYDASLDALAHNEWDYGLHFSRYLPRASYRTGHAGRAYLGGEGAYEWKKEPALAFTCWDPSLFFAPRGAIKMRGTARFGSPVPAYAMAKRESLLTANSADVSQTDEALAEVADMRSTTAGASGGGIETAATEEAAPEVDARCNFAETAFFHPALRTDGSGTVTLSFTLPESLTAWNFRALAHTTGMDWGRLDTTVVARKELMVQAAMPRFVREGDRTEIPATVRNLSGKSVAGTLWCTFADARTGRTVKTLKERFSLVPGGARTIPFLLAETGGVAVYTVRIVATAEDFSDGEEHFLPVLSDRVAVTRALPFSMTEGGSRTLRIDTLWADVRQAADRRLTVETSSNPMWYAVTALPPLADGECHSATEWAARYYAVALADYMAHEVPALRMLSADSAGRGGEGDGLSAWADVLERNPDLKQLLLAETPWVAEAVAEADRTAALRDLFDGRAVAAKRHTALDRLKALQLPDGAWTWYPGMPANRYVTLEVATLLARLRSMAGDRTADEALERGLSYLERQVREDVDAMKEYERKNKREAGVSEWHLRYLYIRTLLGTEDSGQTQADVDYLLQRLGKSMNGATMYAKSLAAIVLAGRGKAQAARDFVRSVAEHTVAKEGMGRWFDTDRAAWSWNAYRIPTQTAAIEALTECARLRLCACPAGGHAADCPLDAAYIGQLRLWLLQSRRTQQWQTSRAATDAIYALLINRNDASEPQVGGLESTAPLYYTLNKDNRIVAANTGEAARSPGMAGYFLRNYDAAPAVEADAITLRKKEGGLAWGAVFAQYTLPTAAVRAAVSGLSLVRRMEVRHGTDWVTVGAKTVLRPGDRVRQVLTVTADRDYDFVSLRSSRAACMEPVRPLSGYQWTGTAACYRVVRDASTDFFIEQLRKGTHTFTDEYFIDRGGKFQCGVASVQSIYAPEFAGIAPGMIVTVE